jgi:uncharacterized OsmC-like protein
LKSGTSATPRSAPVKITLLDEGRLRVEAVPGPLTVEAASAERVYSPFHMVASSLATCIYSVLASWAQTARIELDGLVIEVGWEFADTPHRVGRYDVLLSWPGLPDDRRVAAQRVVALCPIHGTFHHPPTIVVEVAG